MRTGVGLVLRRERARAGRSQRWLAAATGASRRHVQLLEAGQRRPSRPLLRAIAGALDPAEPRPLAETLIAAAGESVVDGCERYWWRRMEPAWWAGRRPLPTGIARSIDRSVST